MGSGMAANIQKAGYPMVVHDIREGATKAYLEKGARLGSAPEEVAGSCEVIFTSLPGPKEVEAVANVEPALELEMPTVREAAVQVDRQAFLVTAGE